MTKQKIKCEIEGCDHSFEFKQITIRSYLDYIKNPTVLGHLKEKHPSLYNEIQVLRQERDKHDDIINDINIKLYAMTKKVYSPNI